MAKKGDPNYPSHHGPIVDAEPVEHHPRPSAPVDSDAAKSGNVRTANANATTQAASTPSKTEQTKSSQHRPGSSNHYYHHLGRSSAVITCPHCQERVTTSVRDRVTCSTVLFVVLLLLLFWPLFWLPLCMPSCKQTSHYCNHCYRPVGKTAPCS